MVAITGRPPLSYPLPVSTPFSLTSVLGNGKQGITEGILVSMIGNLKATASLLAEFSQFHASYRWLNIRLLSTWSSHVALRCILIRCVWDLMEQVMHITNVLSHEYRKCRTSDAFRKLALHKMVCNSKIMYRKYVKFGSRKYPKKFEENHISTWVNPRKSH